MNDQNQGYIYGHRKLGTSGQMGLFWGLQTIHVILHLKKFPDGDILSNNSAMLIQHYEECHLEKLPCCQDEKGPKIQSLREKIAEVETRERELYEEAR